MYKINGNFIGYTTPNQVDFFSGSDTEELYKKNLNNKPDDWYYRNVEITYKRNSLGHRCREISEIDLDNYILVAGCSHTEGIGLELEKSYPYVLAEKLKCDYYNLGIGGSGIDVLLHNLTIWISTQQKMPKALIVQWPHWERFVHFHYDPRKLKDINQLLLHIGSAHTSNKSALDMLMQGEVIHYFKTVEMLAKIKIECMFKHINVPIIHVYVHNKFIFSDNNIICGLQGLDSARDIHSGICSHKQLAEKVYKNIQLLL
jgi:hypothetical protein